MRRKVRVCVMYGDGINCDNETFEAFRMAGAEPRKALIADITDCTVKLEDFQILVFPGGWSAADYLGAGKFYALKLRSLIGRDLIRFVEDGKLILGICNGFQILTKYPLLPSPYSGQTLTVTYNESARFENRWVYIKIDPKSHCIFTKGIDIMHLPCRHAEGRVDVLDSRILESMKQRRQIVARYSHENGRPANGEYPANPNGSLEDIAGICDSSGRIFGWMPHPEAFLHSTNDPCWPARKEKLKRSGGPMPKMGDGLRIFKNAVEYAKENL